MSIKVRHFHFPYTIASDLALFGQKMKLFSFSVIFILLLLQHNANAAPTNFDMDSLTNMDEGSTEAALYRRYIPRKINCNYACAIRCSKARRKNVCGRACKTCCRRCHCVPPGTYGNKSACPCYASLRTHGNKPKCP